MRPQALRCPTCRARLRQGSVCARCGADLAPALQTMLDGYRLRAAARQALLDDDLPQARRLANAAELKHATPPGQALQSLLVCLEALRRS